MATHDYNIANDTGANVRTDLNDVFAAILSNNSSATAPTTTVAYMLWVDTNSNVIKLRNSADDGWITLPLSISADNTVDINGGTVNGITSLSFSSGSTVTSILDEDSLSSDSDSALATQQSIKAYVDAQVTAQDLDFQADSGGALNIDLDSESLTFTGGTGIDTSGSGNEVTFAIDSTVATKTYVQQQITAEDLDFQADSGGVLNIDLDSETFTLSGGTGIDTVGAENTVTFAIDSTVATLSDTQTLTNKTIDADNNTVSNLEVDNLKSGVLDTDLASVSGSDDTLASAKAIKNYVDTQITAEDLDVSDGTTDIAIDLDSEVLGILGGTGVTSAASGNNVTLSIGQSVATSDDVTFNTVTTDVTGTVSSIANHSTSDLSEGTNLYYTTARFDSRLATKDTDDLTEGSNLYFTDERVDDRVSNLLTAGSNVTLTYDDSAGTLTIAATEDDLSNNTTSDLAEGTNLYYTNERVDDRVSSLIQNGTGISWSYDDANGTFTPTVSLSPYSTSDLSEGTNLYYTTARFDTRLASKDTDDLTEGSSNLYFTNARARSAISVSGDLAYNSSTGVISFTERTDAEVRGLISVSGDLAYNSSTGVVSFTERTDAEVRGLVSASGDLSYDSSTGAFSFTERTDAEVRGLVSAGGDLSYNSTTGVFSFTERTDSEVQGLITGGTGVTVTAGEVAIGQSVGTSDDVTFNDLTVSGNLTVSGTTTNVNTETINLADNQIVLNSNYTGSTPTENGGIEIERGTQTNKTLVWNETDDKWTVGSETFVAGTFEGALSGNVTGNLTGNVTGTVSDVSNHDTDDISEGSTNLYYTDARANSAFDTRLATKDTDNLSEGSSNLYYTDARVNSAFDTRLATKDTDNLSEGSTNLYYTDARANSAFDTRLATKDTGDLTEGSNLYYTDARSRSSVSVGTEGTASGDGAIAYNSSTGVFTYTPPVLSGLTGDTDDISEGSTNLYHTTERVQDVVGGQLVTNGSHTGISFSYDDANDGAIDATVSLSSFDTDNLSEGSTNLYYTDARVDAHLSGGTGVTYSSGAISIGQSVGTSDSVTFAGVTSDFTGDLDGAVKFTAKADVALTKGQVVYISGVSGDVPTVDLADADNSSAMPAFGLVAASANQNASVEIITFGSLTDFDTSGFTVGDTVFVSTTAGDLTATAPSGESSLIQNIGQVQRSHASAGIIKVGGAGRSNATPNLNNGKIFLGNASNQAAATTLDTSVVPENTNLYFTDERVDDRVNNLLTAGTGISLSYDDAANTLTITGSAQYGDSDVESYLDGGTSTPTFASAIVSGDLTVDTNTLVVDSSNNRVGILDATPAVSLDIGSATDAVHVPSGTTAQRPTGANGMFRYNSTDNQFEGYADGAWGAIAGSGGASAMETDNFTGDDATTAFTLSSSVSDEDNLIVFIDGVYQNKADYVASGTTLTLDTAPVAGRKIVVHHVRAAISGSNCILNSFTGDGSDTTFTLTQNPASENNTQIFIDGVYQRKDSYSVSGTTLTFDAAPANGTAIEVMMFTQTDINTLPASFVSGLTEVTATGSDHLMVYDATDGALKKALASDLIETVGSTPTFTSATISGDLTVDTSTLKVDSTNNRVGVGTVSPSTPLDVVGSTGIRVNEDGSGTKVINIRSDFAGVDPAINVSTNHGLLFQTNNTERARIAADGAFGIANQNPHFDLDTNEARLGYYSAKGLGYNFFTTSINFSSGTSTKYIAISYTLGLFYNLDLDLHGQYGNFNAEGGIRKVYTGGVNASDTTIYGNGNAQLFSLGNTATYYSTGTAAKSGATKIRIPITGTSLPNTDTLHVGIRIFGIHLDRITSIAIE